MSEVIITAFMSIACYDVVSDGLTLTTRVRRTLLPVLGKHVHSSAKLRLWRPFGDLFIDMSRVVVC